MVNILLSFLVEGQQLFFTFLNAHPGPDFHRPPPACVTTNPLYRAKNDTHHSNFLVAFAWKRLFKNSTAPVVPDPVNHAPIVSTTATIIAANPFKAELKVAASDADNDALSYNCDFGEGTTKNGCAYETLCILRIKYLQSIHG